jgi:hypothetical protein
MQQNGRPRESLKREWQSLLNDLPKLSQKMNSAWQASGDICLRTRLDPENALMRSRNGLSKNARSARKSRRRRQRFALQRYQKVLSDTSITRSKGERGRRKGQKKVVLPSEHLYDIALLMFSSTEGRERGNSIIVNIATAKLTAISVLRRRRKRFVVGVESDG